MVMNVGVIGCGNISGIYLENSKRFTEFNIVAVADIDMSKAQAAADSYNIEKVMTVDEILTSGEIDIILNLTIPKAHTEICLRAIENKKHVYTEKPLSIAFEDGKKIIEAAKDNGVRVGGAPDTFLGWSIQKAAQLIEDGAIGRVVSGSATMLTLGPAKWHSNPDFWYQVGGGPMYDMGPYYLTALVSMLGPVKKIAGMAKLSYSEIEIANGERSGEKIPVEVPTHVDGMLEFECGVVVNITTGFDTPSTKVPNIELRGTEGTLAMPDPNYFNRPLEIQKSSHEWDEILPERDEKDNLRGIGLADMAKSIEGHLLHKASGDLTLHVLEIMYGVHKSSEEGMHYVMETTCEKPSLLDKGEISI